MTVLSNTWRQLVRRRLWPVAVLLVAALAAVPVLLKRDGEPVAAPSAPVPVESAQVEDSLGEPVVAMASPEDRDRRRRVLGARKDPFEPAPAPKAKKPEQPEQPEQPGPGPGGSEPPKTPDFGGGGVTVPSLPDIGGGAPIGGAPVVPAPVEEPTEEKKTYPANSLIVRFGDATTDMRTRTVLERLEALPEGSGTTDSQPLLVYLGLDEDRTSAIFMVDDAAEATGDGSCKPHPSNCETIHLRKGEIEFFDVKDEAGTVVAQYQLDLVKINAKRKTSAKQARRAIARATKAGRRTLGVAAQVSAGL